MEANNVKTLTIDDLKQISLGRVDELLRQGRISREIAAEYIHLWNTSAFRFTEAYLSLDGTRIYQRNLGELYT
jgi:hypothetical protein